MEYNKKRKEKKFMVFICKSSWEGRGVSWDGGNKGWVIWPFKSLGV